MNDVLLKGKVSASICRKVAEEIRDGKCTHSFLYIDKCFEGVKRLMVSKDFCCPVNIGSDEMITIYMLAETAMWRSHPYGRRCR